jgi:predicted dehydrogenase
MTHGETIRYGVLGCSHYHADFWTEGLRTDPGVVVVGVWDSDPSRADEFARRHGTQTYTDRDSLLRDCDMVGITSTTADHPSLVEAALAAGVHVVCEKPLAMGLDGCDRIIRAAASSDAHVLANMPKRFDPVNVELREVINSGRLGTVHLARVRHGHHHGLEPGFGDQWFADPESSGGGTLFDEGIHAFDLLRWLFGDPDVISATVSSTLDLGVEDNATATLSFSSGPVAQVSTSWSFVAAEASVEIYGTRGTALLGGVDLASRGRTDPYLRVYQHDEQTWRRGEVASTFVTPEFHAAGPRHLASAIRNGHPLAVSIEDGAAAVAIVQAAYEAARTCSPVRYSAPAPAATQ